MKFKFLNIPIPLLLLSLLLLSNTTYADKYPKVIGIKLGGPYKGTYQAYLKSGRPICTPSPPGLNFENYMQWCGKNGLPDGEDVGRGLYNSYYYSSPLVDVSEMIYVIYDVYNGTIFRIKAPMYSGYYSIIKKLEGKYGVVEKQEKYSEEIVENDENGKKNLFSIFKKAKEKKKIKILHSIKHVWDKGNMKIELYHTPNSSPYHNYEFSDEDGGLPGKLPSPGISGAGYDTILIYTWLPILKPLNDALKERDEREQNVL